LFGEYNIMENAQGEKNAPAKIKAIFRRRIG